MNNKDTVLDKAIIKLEHPVNPKKIIWTVARRGNDGSSTLLAVFECPSKYVIEDDESEEEVMEMD